MQKYNLHVAWMIKLYFLAITKKYHKILEWKAIDDQCNHISECAITDQIWVRTLMMSYSKKTSKPKMYIYENNMVQGAMVGFIRKRVSQKNDLVFDLTKIDEIFVCW